MSVVLRPALLVHTFWSGGGEIPESLTGLWRRIGEEGLDRPIGDLPLEPCATGTGSPGQLTVLAASSGDRSGSPPPVRQALAFRLDDTIGLSVLRAPNLDDPAIWQAPAGTPPADALGGVTVRFGLTRDPLDAPADAAAAARRLRHLIPGPLDVDQPAGYADGITVWQSPGSLLVLAPHDREDALDRWLWSPDPPGLPPLTRHLLHLTKLRYQRDVLIRDLPALRASRAEVNALATTVTGALGDARAPLERLTRTAGDLAVLQAGTDGLIGALARVRTMARTVETARVNAAATLGDPRFGAAPERPTAEWTAEQLRSEEAYLAAATERVGALIAAVRLAVEQGTRERVEGRTLLQTSLIGGLLTALAAIQSLQYAVALPGSLKAPLIALLTALAIWLPSAVLHWAPGSRPAGGWRSFDVVLLAAVCAAAGWLTAATAVRYSAGVPAAAWVSLLAAAGGAAAGLTVARFLRLRERR